MHNFQIENSLQKQSAVRLNYSNFTKSLRKLPLVMAVLLSCGQGCPAYADQSNGADKSYKAGSEEYRNAMSEYGKEIFAARYTEKWCGMRKGVHFNEVYFRVGPPNLWDKNVYDKFMSAAMGYTRSLMDKQIVALGEDQFCMAMIEFYKENYRDAVKPVMFSN
jgi:hypothetical protein